MKLLQPTSLPQAVSLLNKSGKEAAILAGGTDLIVQTRRGSTTLPETLIYLGGITQLRRLRIDSTGHLHIGAMVTHSMVQDSPAARTSWPALVDATSIVGSPATRNVGTIGGNLCNGSPAMEVGAPLLAYGAQVLLVSAKGRRSMDIGDFLLGPGSTARGAIEVLTDVVVSPASSWDGSAYIRLGFREAMEIAIVGAAAALKLGQGGRIERCQIALTAVAPTIVRAPAAERILTDAVPSSDVIDRAARATGSAIEPIDDLRATANYRREVMSVIVRRTIELALARTRAGQGSVLGGLQ